MISLRPSGASVWRWCSAAPHVEAKYPPQPPHDVTIRGAAAHEIVRTELMNPSGGQLRELLDASIIVTDEVTGQVDEVFPDYELLAAVKTCLDHVEQLREQLREQRPNLIEEWIEEPVEIWSGYKGTPDYALWDHDSDTLYVVDWKFGYVEVSPEMNWQLLSYAWGICQTYDIHPERIVFQIGQPLGRAWPKIREWSCTYEELEDGHIPLLQKAAQEVLNGPQSRRAGAHCRYCSGQMECSAYQDMGDGLFQAFQMLPEDQRTADLPALHAFFTRGKEMFTNGLKSVDQRIFSELSAGNPVTGFGLKDIPGRRTIKKNLDKADIERLRLIGEWYGVNTVRDNPMTLAQMKKAQIPEECFDGLIEQGSGSIKVVPVDTQQELKEIFGE